MKPVQLKWIQAIFELAFPLAGYFFWGWGLYFILLFYILDLLVSITFSFVKARRILAFHQQTGFNFRHLALTVLLLSASFFILGGILRQLKPGFDFGAETWKFLAYTEWGIAQGVILVPLLVYTGYAQYKMNFLLPGRFATLSTESLWRTHFSTLLLVLGISAALLAFSFWLVFPELVYIIGLIAGATAYRTFVLRS